MTRFLRHTALLALVAALATVFVGWWTVPLVAGIWTLAVPRRGSALSAALAAAAAWSALLAIAARSGPIGGVADLMGQVLSVPPPAVITLTVAYGALLAGSAALVAQAVRPPAENVRPTG